MSYLIATDEAGLGPNLGPLVVSASLWELPSDRSPGSMFEVLADCVVDRVEAACDGRFAVADSKRLFKPGSSTLHLERGVLTGLASLGRLPATWRRFFDDLDPASTPEREAVPWYAEYDEPLPIDVDVAEIERLSQQFERTCQTGRVRLCDLRSRIVYPREFNRGLEDSNKGALLSRVTLALVAEIAAPLDAPVAIVCDKHGGRNRYADLLAEHFPNDFIEIRGEGREMSVYAFGPADRRVEIQFRTRAESNLAVAYASMVSKFLRELSMRAFNRFWCSHVEELRPTAGYPQDAKRFRLATDAARSEMRIADELFWRRK